METNYFNQTTGESINKNIRSLINVNRQIEIFQDYFYPISIWCIIYLFDNIILPAINGFKVKKLQQITAFEILAVITIALIEVYITDGKKKRLQTKRGKIVKNIKLLVSTSELSIFVKSKLPIKNNSNHINELLKQIVEINQMSFLQENTNEFLYTQQIDYCMPLN